MRSDEVGRKILETQPRIWNFETLVNLNKEMESKPHTLGHNYLKFMTGFDLDPSGRPLV